MNKNKDLLSKMSFEFIISNITGQQVPAFLRLMVLTSLSVAAAESLSKHVVDLDLSGLTALSDAVAESLSKYKGDSLNLSGLTSLSDNSREF